MTTQTSTAGALARASASYTGDGATTQFAVPFPVTRRPEVVVTVAGSVVTNYTWAADNSSITFAAAPANLAAIKIIEGASKHASGAILVDPMKTKSTVGLGDQQATAALATVTSTESGVITNHVNVDDVQGTLPAFTTTVTRVNH